MASDYTQTALDLATIAATTSPYKAAADTAQALRAAYEAGRVEGAAEMRERAACEAGDALAERGYHFGGVVARVRALPTSPETLAEAARRVGPPPDGVLAVGPPEDTVTISAARLGRLVAVAQSVHDTMCIQTPKPLYDLAARLDGNDLDLPEPTP